MATITKLSLFVINSIKLRRLVLGIPASRLANFLNHDKSYIFNIEKNELPAQYPIHEYPALAQALDWETHDLLPPDEADQKSDGTLVEKTVLSLSNEADMQLVLEGMIAHGFFYEGKTIAETAKHLFIEGKAEEKVLQKVLSSLTKSNRLKVNKDKITKV